MLTGRLSPVPARLMALNGWRADLAAVLSGMISALALPPAVRSARLADRHTRSALPYPRGARPGGRGPCAAGGSASGCISSGCTWITEAILIEAARFWWLVPLAVPATGGGDGGVYRGLRRRGVVRPAWLARRIHPGGAWVLADLARQFVATGFPWNPLGSVWEFPAAPGDIMIQPACADRRPWADAGDGLARLACRCWAGLGAPAALAVLALWIGFGVVRLDQPMPPGPDLTVLLIQGNVAQGQKWDRALHGVDIPPLSGSDREAVAKADGRPAVVVWPETASPALLQTDGEARS